MLLEAHPIPAHLVVAPPKLAKYERKCVVSGKNYTTAGHNGRNKFQVWALPRPPSFGQNPKEQQFLLGGGVESIPDIFSTAGALVVVTV